MRRAASQLDVDWVLVRSGGSPGLMYAESRNGRLEDWVAAVQALRYKDFRCVSKPTLMSDHVTGGKKQGSESTVHQAAAGFHETESIAEFAREMEARNLTCWWKRGMGYEK